MVPGKENVGNFGFCRMAPSVMTSGDPESQNCFRFVLLFQLRFAQNVRDRFLPFILQLVGLPALIIAAKIGLLSLKGCCHRNEFSSFSDIFRPIRVLFCSA